MVKRHEWLPLYLLHLLWAVSPTLFSLILPSLRQQTSLILATIFFLTVSISYIVGGTSPWHKASLLTIQLAPPLPPEEVLPVSDPTMPWKALYQLQPFHRDILVNLGRTLINTDQTSLATPYLQAAQNLDPNSPLFQAN